VLRKSPKVTWVTIRTTRVVLACAHLTHNPTDNRARNLAASANAAIYCTTPPSIGVNAGPPCSNARVQEAPVSSSTDASAT
jgi:hypothetical protein